MDMSHEDLFRQSEEFRDWFVMEPLLKKQKSVWPNRAGQVAARTVFRWLLPLSTLVSRFEANPSRLLRLVVHCKGIGKETMEELVQSGTGQFAQNVGTTVADNER